MAGLTMGRRGRPPAPRRVVDVAVGVVRGPDGRVLMTERTAGKPGAGFWEFPGGKVDPGEDPAQAAKRELLEEVGLRARKLAPGPVHEHDFATTRVRLHFFHVRSWEGQAQSKEGQRLAWVEPARPAVGPVLPSVERALATLALPEVAAVARPGRASDGAEGVLARLPTLLARGLRLLIVRAPEMAPAQRVQLTRRLRQLAHGSPLRLLVSATALEAHQSGACGLHSSAAELARTTARPQVRLWAVSAHNAGDLERAAALGADFALVSPVLPSPTHPTQPALGWDGLRELAASCPMPLYAQGGMRPSDLGTARDTGALGVAVDLSRISGDDLAATRPSARTDRA